MVKIPELAEDSQNWKIYCTKYLEVAATENLLSIVAGWESDDGSKDWDHRNRVARMLLYITLPPLLRLHIRLLENAREVFQYLAYYFLDADPIVDPHAKKLTTCANNDKCYLSVKSPTSENAATGADREDPPTKDPHTSLEALAEGTSTKRAEGPMAPCAATLHETQNVPQNSLPLTPRLPIDGKPGECKQEVANSVVTAGCTKGMVGMANLPEMDADVDRTALLGGEPAERVCGVDKGDKMDREYQLRIQQTNRKKHQHNAT